MAIYNFYETALTNMPPNVRNFRNVDNVQNVAATDCLNDKRRKTISNSPTEFQSAWYTSNLKNGLNEYAVKKWIWKTVKNSKLFEP